MDGGAVRVHRQPPQHAVALPFWLAGDHFMFVWGRANGRPPVLLFVDIGPAGGGFLCSEDAARD